VFWHGVLCDCALAVVAFQHLWGVHEWSAGLKCFCDV
jgi:hypothetical protein